MEAVSNWLREMELGWVSAFQVPPEIRNKLHMCTKGSVAGDSLQPSTCNWATICAFIAERCNSTEHSGKAKACKSSSKLLH